MYDNVFKCKFQERIIKNLKYHTILIFFLSLLNKQLVSIMVAGDCVGGKPIWVPPLGSAEHQLRLAAENWARSAVPYETCRKALGANAVYTYLKYGMRNHLRHMQNDVRLSDEVRAKAVKALQELKDRDSHMEMRARHDEFVSRPHLARYPFPAPRRRVRI